MNKAARILLGLAMSGISPIASAPAQQIDTMRLAEANPKIDTTKKVDTLRAGRDSATKSEKAKETAAPVSLKTLGTVDGGVRLEADLSARQLRVVGANGTIKTFAVAIGSPSYPTPTGSYKIRKIVWNPSWVPPDSKWAKGKTAKGPGEPGNPMKVAKIFFKEPDFYIHGTGDTKSLGSAASHGCLRMDPDDVAELAQFLMQNGGQAREEGWFSRVIHMRWKTHTVYLSQPIALQVTR